MPGSELHESPTALLLLAIFLVSLHVVSDTGRLAHLCRWFNWLDSSMSHFDQQAVFRDSHEMPQLAQRITFSVLTERPNTGSQWLYMQCRLSDTIIP